MRLEQMKICASQKGKDKDLEILIDNYDLD